MRCGKGHLETPNGTTFEGQFNKGLPNGLGMMRFPDGSRYEGEFMQGWFHGHGIFATRDGTAFEGRYYVSVPGLKSPIFKNVALLEIREISYLLISR